MAEGDGKTVLVTGGSGYLGGWCIVELLRRGYRVRTTVRDPAREPEVHEAVASQVDPGHHLTVHQADLLSDEHWENVDRGLRLRPPRRLPLPAEPAEGPGRADRPGPRGDAARARQGARRRRQAGGGHLLDRGDQAGDEAPSRGRSTRRTGPTRTRTA